MTKKTMVLAGMLVCMVVFGAKAAHAQTVSLDTAIQNTTANVSSGLASGTRIAIVSMQAASVGMSNYLIDEVNATLIRMGRFSVLDRSQLDLVAQELHFQTSGWVDDASAQSIGFFMGVQSVVTGTFEPFGASYRLVLRVIAVTTGVIQGIHSETVENTYIIASLLGPAGRGQALQPVQPARTMHANAPEMRNSIFSVGANLLLLANVRRIGSVQAEERDHFDPNIEYSMEAGLTHWGIAGVWGFVDARFLDLSFGLMGGRATLASKTVERHIGSGWGEVESAQSESGSFFATDLNLLGRIPIAFGNGHYFSPLFGIGWNFVLSADMGQGARSITFDDPSIFSTFRVQFGLGWDIAWASNPRWFNRISLLASYTFPSSFFVDTARELNTLSEITAAGYNGGWGGTLLFGIGRRL